MELPPSRYFSQNSKKRVFPGGSSTNVQVPEVSSTIARISKSENAKQKEPIHHGDVDMKGGDNDVMFIDGNTGSRGKGKDFLELSLGYGDSAYSVGPSQVQSSKKHCPSESGEVPANLFYEDNPSIDMYFSELANYDYAILQSHFDHMDTPPGVEVPIPWMSGFAKAKMASATTSTSSTSKALSSPFGRETPEVLKYPSTSIYDLNHIFKPTPVELSSSSLGPAVVEGKFSAKANSKGICFKEQNGSTNVSPGVEKSLNVQGSHLRRKIHLSPGTVSQSWHTPSIPGGVPFPTAHFVPPPMPSWMNLPPNMPTAQASSGFMLAPGAMNPLPLHQVHPGFMLAPGDMNPLPLHQVHPGFMLATGDMISLPLEQVHPGYIIPPDTMNYFLPELLSTGPVLAPGAMHYFHQEMDHELWTHGPHNSASLSLQCESAPSKEQHGNLGESLKNFRLFKKFDTVQDHSGHYFSGLASHDNLASKSCAKRILEEWKILEKDLPDTIFVRVYETRMDLLRAVIIGADGTPYHDGLFFFDVYFPSNYPNVPPHVHYHSFGLRINPNLYECGKVCLSLLNTWDGRGKEKWIPGESTMLQVLVSIQGLILNAKPYFNEPGYARMNGSASGERNSLRYNENTCIFNLKTMVYCMRRPPQHFEDFVIGHYFQSCQDILVACKAYMEGARVGSLVRGCVLGDGGKGGDKGGSRSFKAMLAGFIGVLVEAFKKIGCEDCDKFLPLAEKASTRATPVKID
ncbi:uncharacterized protein [Solanum lycopersicum]|uniref:uncharacterized protein isoform X2 n=2 Tax=Solanum lycopersicum TaxID=4081 RepID=UPI0037498AD1